MKKIFTFASLLCIIAVNAFPQLPTENLLGYWPFNGNANDVIGSNHGIVSGATLCANRFNSPDKAYYFDGKNDNISLLFENTIDINTKSSILLWFKAEEHLNAYAKLISVPVSLETWNNPYHYLAFSGPAFNYANFDPINGFCETPPFTSTVDTNWNLLAFTYNEGEIKVYINGILKETLSCSSTLMPIGGTMSIGSRSTSKSNDGEYFTGIIDDLSIHDTVLSQSEILEYYNFTCDDQSREITYSYYVSDSTFKSIGYRKYYDSTLTKNGSYGCDSLINYYSQFIYKENKHVDTTIIFDTITVTDTLILNVTISNLNNNQNIFRIKVFPNPASDIIYIDLAENFEYLSGYKISIINALGKSVFESQLTERKFEIRINDFGEYGLYLISIQDKTGKVIESKKLLLK